MSEDPLNETSQSDGVATKMWKGREVLFVYFLNPELLLGRLNVNKVMDWAKKWSESDIPKFERTNSSGDADITVEFGSKSWHDIVKINQMLIHSTY